MVLLPSLRDPRLHVAAVILALQGKDFSQVEVNERISHEAAVHLLEVKVGREMAEKMLSGEFVSEVMRELDEWTSDPSHKDVVLNAIRMGREASLHRRAQQDREDQDDA